jgi:RNA polymerase sigma-70 factor (ECF subfamily)
MRNTGTLRERRLDFERTALPHLDAIYTTALRLLRNSDDAQDLLQETVLRAYRCFHQFRPGTNCRAWLLTILYNIFRTAYRRGTREHLASDSGEFEREIEAQSLEESLGDPAAICARRGTVRLIEQALSGLPAGFREALLLVDLHELNYQEVSITLDIPVGTVKSRVSRGRALMRSALEKLAVRPGKTGT